MTGVIVVPEKKSPFFDIFFRNLPYSLAAGIVRAIKTGLSFILAGVTVGIADGTLLKGIGFIPAGYLPILTLMLSMVIIGLEKSLREKGLLDDVKDLPTSTAGEGPPTGDVTIVTPPSETDEPPPDVQGGLIIQPDDPVVNEPLVVKDDHDKISPV